MNTTTSLENQVLRNIVKSEYQPGNDPELIIDNEVWSFSATNSRKDMAGALGSLVKKGLVGTGDQDKMDTCWVTKEGYECFINNQING